ncbi:MAG: hypothetical protein OEZ02_00735 [Anaerolineae bacterium]|nr:hypothetical protein [Anaerolineae bacterium]
MNNKRSPDLIVWAVLVAMAASGCAKTQGSNTPFVAGGQASATASGTPASEDGSTAIPLELISTVDLTPKATSVVVSPDPNATPSATAVKNSVIPPGFEFPEAAITIYRPGELSKVVSPFKLIANLTPGHNSKVLVELLGEDGRTLSRKLLHAPLPPGRARRDIVTEMDFEIAAVAETGRLQISVQDEYGRMSAMSSVNLILISEGISQLNHYGDTRERIIIMSPNTYQTSTGLTLDVYGLARLPNELPLVVEIYDRENHVLGAGLAAIVADDESEYGFFATNIPLNLAGETWIRVVVRARGTKLPGTVFLSSVEVLHYPFPTATPTATATATPTATPSPTPTTTATATPREAIPINE